MSNMKIHTVRQSTPEWLALRDQADGTASEAPTMMGAGYGTREALLEQKFTSIKPEIDARTQRLFDKGHETEAAYRPIAELDIGEELFPATVSREVEGLMLLASCDGMTMDGGTLFEHKLHSTKLSMLLDAYGEPGPKHYWQLEHQLLVTGATRVLFVTSDGTRDCVSTCWYISKPDRREQLIEGWKIFKRDLANWAPSTVVSTPVGESVEQLPALRVEVSGELTVGGNIAEWRASAARWLESAPKTFATDQDFANADTFGKACGEAEARLDVVKAQALAQSRPLEELVISIDAIQATFREKRLALERVVKQQKLTIKVAAVSKAALELSGYINIIELDMGARYMPAILGDFAEAIKGKRSITSMQSSLDSELAACKLTAELAAKKIRANLASLKVGDVDHTSLFPDLKAVVNKETEDFAALLQVRSAARQALVDKAAAYAVAKAAHEAQEAARRQAAAESDAAARAAHEAGAPARELAAEQQRQERLLQEKKHADDCRAQDLEISRKWEAENSIIEQAKASAKAQNLARQQAELTQANLLPSDDGKRINLTGINARLAPVSITGAGLADLGFEPVEILNASRLYRASEFPAICQAICARVSLAALSLRASTV